VPDFVEISLACSALVRARAVRGGRAESTRAFKPDSIRGKILSLVSAPGVADAIRAQPICVADLAASLPCPAGKELEQWKKEIGSVVAVDLAKETGLFIACALRRAGKGLFTLAPELTEEERLRDE
jgi:hypothetical protein